LRHRRLRDLRPFPTRRSSDLAGTETTTSVSFNAAPTDRLKLNSQFSRRMPDHGSALNTFDLGWSARAGNQLALDGGLGHTSAGRDRKSTRLNSSHDQSSYAVF